MDRSSPALIALAYENEEFLAQLLARLMAMLMAIGGISLGARYSLKLFIAQAAAPAPDKIVSPFAESRLRLATPSLPSTANSSHFTFCFKRFFRVLAALAIFGCFEAGLLFVLPDHEGWANGFWAVVCLVFMGIVSGKAESILKSSSQRLTRTSQGRYLLTPIAQLPLSTWTRSLSSTHLYRVAQYIFVFLWFFSHITPFLSPLSMITGCGVTLLNTAIMTSALQGSMLRMKVIVSALSLYPIIIVIATVAGQLTSQGNLDLGEMMKRWNEVEDTEDKGIFGVGKEVGEMMWTIGRGMMIGLLGWMAAIALRFDYSLHIASHPESSPTLTLITTPLTPSRAFPSVNKSFVPGLAGVVVPPSASIPKFPKPTYHAAIFSLLIGWGVAYGWYGIGASGWGPIRGLSLPLVGGAMILSAWRQGVWKEFWGYRESWSLKPTPADDIESSLSSTETIDARETKVESEQGISDAKREEEDVEVLVDAKPS